MCIIYLTKQFWQPLKLSLPRGLRPKYARASPQHLAHTVPDFTLSNQFTFDGVIAECVKTIFCSIEYLHDRFFEPISYNYNDPRLQIKCFQNQSPCSI